MMRSPLDLIFLLLVRASVITCVVCGVFSYEEGITLSDFASTELYRREEACRRIKSSWRIFETRTRPSHVSYSRNSQCLRVTGTALRVSMGLTAMPASL